MRETETRAAGVNASAGGGFSIDPGQGADLTKVTRAIYVGTGGTLVVEMQWGETVSFENVPDGALLPIRVKRVLPATSAASIVGLY